MLFDSKGFRGNPDPYDQTVIGLANAAEAAQKHAQQQQIIYMQPLHGGNDMRPKCAANIPPGQQYATRQLIIKHADSIIDLSRKRHEERMIDAQPIRDGTVSFPGYEVIAKCNKDACAYSSTGTITGIGVYREDTVPELHGTWSNAYMYKGNVEGFGQSRLEEGGRNTRRG